MKHRDRVLMALNHEVPDRCPLQVSFTPEFATRLKNDLGLKDEDFHNPHGGGNTYVLERSLDEDMLLTSVGWANSYYATETYTENGDTYVDEWGVTWKNVAYETDFGTGHYTEMVGHPLADDLAIDSYQPPDPNRPELYHEAERVIEEYGDEYWIVGVTVTTIFETAWALRGYEKTLMDLALNPDYVEKLFDIPFNYHLTAAKKLVELGVDMIWTGDDVGAQNRMLVSPDTWRRFLKPRLATFFSTLKDINPDLKIAYHSDGVIYPIIPDLIEMGLAVINGGVKSHKIMVAVPYLTGLSLGEDRETNLGVRLREFGQSHAPAWSLNGDIYSRGWSGQWNAAYESAMDEGIGMIIKDPDIIDKKN